MKRIGGLDLARALAIYGMFAAHIGDTDLRDHDGDGWPWLWIADGRSSALFAVLAGVSLSIMLMRRADAAGHDQPSDADIAHTRVRIAVRAVVLVVVGYGLTALGTPVDIILVNLALMFVLSLFATRWRPVALAAASAVLVVGGLWLTRRTSGAGARLHLLDAPVVEKLWSYHYPAIAWMAYILAGMAVGKLALGSRLVRGRLVVGGLVLAAVAYGSGVALGGPGLAPGVRGVPGGSHEWASVEAHSYTPFEMAGNLGIALAVIGVCLWTADAATRRRWSGTLAYPGLAVGSMAFTAYVIQVVVIAAAGEDIVWNPSNGALLALCAGVTMFAVAWRAALGQGPLERAMTWASMRAADAAVGRRRVGARS